MEPNTGLLVGVLILTGVLGFLFGRLAEGLGADAVRVQLADAEERLRRALADLNSAEMREIQGVLER